MWPVDEIEEDERSVADADIAGTRTTLQPAHHLTDFVPGARPGVFFECFSGAVWLRREDARGST